MPSTASSASSPSARTWRRKASVEAFLGKLGDRARSPPITTRQMALSGALGVQVMPTTILYDADGKEVWRYVGDLDWTGAEAAKLLSEAK